MHQVIRILIYADCERSALDQAKTLVDTIIAGEGSPFDYGILFNEDTPIAGKRRWGEYPVIAELKEPENWRTKLVLSKIDSKTVMDKELSEDEKAWILLREGIEFTKQELFRNLNKIRVGLAEYSNEEFWEFDEEKERSMYEKHGIDLLSIKSAMSNVAPFRSTDYFLYSEEGLPIETFNQLIEILERKKQPSYRNKKLFIIPVDVHY